MRNINILLWSILLVLSLLNYDFKKLSPFETSKSNILDILIIVCCIGAIIYSLTKETVKPRNPN